MVWCSSCGLVRLCRLMSFSGSAEQICRAGRRSTHTGGLALRSEVECVGDAALQQNLLAARQISVQLRLLEGGHRAQFPLRGTPVVGSIAPVFSSMFSSRWLAGCVGGG